MLSDEKVVELVVSMTTAAIANTEHFSILNGANGKALSSSWIKHTRN